MSELRKRLTVVAAIAFLSVATLVFLEGSASFLVFARTLYHDRVAEEGHTERDSLLGWINKPNVSRPNHYATGIGFHTNLQRFRHIGDLAPRAPAGIRRVVCSGDSFTLGYGVSDAQTWCQLLAASDSSLETINMGQGGYGLDQAYLWYVRDGLPLHPSLQIFAFITPDFRRMQNDHANGFPKPRLELAGNGLRAVGVPVRQPGMGPAMLKLGNAVRTLRMFELVSAYVRMAPRFSDPAPKDSATWLVANAALRDLARRDSAEAAALVVVYLPMLDDYKKPVADRFRRWARDAAARGDFRFVDLITPFRALPPDSVDELFIPEGMLAFHGATGHYTAAGNAWVARELELLVPELRH
ncbi:hypothetical protein BH09GEM1_BH09GEM1_41470 [soil metagenome]